MKTRINLSRFIQIGISFGIGLAACSPAQTSTKTSNVVLSPTGLTEAFPDVLPTSTLPYDPGELVSYTVQPGDTLQAIAKHFNTSTQEIHEANAVLPGVTTTLPPGLPLQIPIYYRPFWGSAFQIIPDSHFINGPYQVGFNSESFISKFPGWLSTYVEYAAGENRNSGNIIDIVSKNFSVSPRMLIALLEYQTNALLDETQKQPDSQFILGNIDDQYKGLYMQLVWAANQLNNGYYGWRTGSLTVYSLADGSIERPNPWQNAASVALQNYFRFRPRDARRLDISPEGYAATYIKLFGDPWEDNTIHIPGSLLQPGFSLPFSSGETWAYTGGPHTGWGDGEPFAALDFAPPAAVTGCAPSDKKAIAIADGRVVRSEPGTVVLDLDKDGDERTGWIIIYFHIGTEGRAPTGIELSQGETIGYPSCEGGKATGSHIHIARKFNGEWIPAAGALPFNMEGWIPFQGPKPYMGTLVKISQIVTACECANRLSQLQSNFP